MFSYQFTVYLSGYSVGSRPEAIWLEKNAPGAEAGTRNLGSIGSLLRMKILRMLFHHDAIAS